MPEATYGAAYQLANTAAFQQQVTIALYNALNAALASSDPTVAQISAQYIGQDLAGPAQRSAYRIADQMPGLTPNDATVQAAVTALIPATGSFVL